MDPHPKSIASDFLYHFRGCSVSHTCAAASQGHTERNKKIKGKKDEESFKLLMMMAKGGDIGLDPILGALVIRHLVTFQLLLLLETHFLVKIVHIMRVPRVQLSTTSLSAKISTTHVI